MARGWSVSSRTLRWFSWWLALLAVCCGMEKPVMEIRLEQTQGTGIKAALLNRGQQAKAVLHSTHLQPSRVVLKDASGREIEPFDNRTRAKFDRTVRAAMFQKVAPGGSLELGTAEFRKAAGGQYELQWGPYLYGDLQPGPWSVSVVLVSTVNAPTGGAPIADAWTGKAVSNWITVQLPR